MPNELAGNTPEYLIVGQIVAPFGIKGKLKVNILTEFPDRFDKLEEVVLAPFSFIEPGLIPPASLNPGTLRRSLGASTPRARAWKPPAGPEPFAIQSTHIHKGQLLLTLTGVDSPEAADALRGYWVLVPTASARKLPRGAYYVYQIVGLEVYTQAGDLVGKIEDVLTASANDIYIVKGPGVRDPSGELLVPAIKSVVKLMELKQGRIIIADPQEWQ